MRPKLCLLAIVAICCIQCTSSTESSNARETKEEPSEFEVATDDYLEPEELETVDDSVAFLMEEYEPQVLEEVRAYRIEPEYEVSEEILEINEELKFYDEERIEEAMALNRTFQPLMSIYQDDDRHEINETESDVYRSISQTVVCMVDTALLNRFDDSTFILRSNQSLADRIDGICENERFVDQPVVGVCSGFAVSDSVILTAAHCLEPEEFQKYVFIFDLTFDKVLPEGIILPDSLVYFPDNLIYHPKRDRKSHDYAKLLVSKTIPNHRIPLFAPPETRIRKDDSVYCIGHPLGLTMKVIDNAIVQCRLPSKNFKVTLDTYRGSSGSPVFHKSTNQLVGMLRDGQKDFTDFNSNCSYSYIIDEPDCRNSESVLSIHNIE